MAAQKAQRRMKSDEMAPGEARPGPRAVQLPVRDPEPSPAPEAEARARPAGETVAPAQQAAVSAPKGKRKAIFSLVGAAALVAAGWYGYHYMTVGRFIVSTDDAYVGAYMSMVSPKVSANVVAVPIVDNQAIKAGDILDSARPRRLQARRRPSRRQGRHPTFNDRNVRCADQVRGGRCSAGASST